MAPTSRNASCSGCSAPPASSPSMVVMWCPAAAPTFTRQEWAGIPSIRTVHAPHCPSPQPYLAPVRSRSSRRTLSRVRSESALRRRLVPLTWSSVTLGMPSLSHLDGLKTERIFFPPPAYLSNMQTSRYAMAALFVSAAAFSQAQPPREFEVASIRQSAPFNGRVNLHVQVDGSQLHCTFFSL